MLFDPRVLGLTPFLFLGLGATAEERGRVRDMETGFLVFPDDYEEQLPEIVDRLRAKYDSATSR